VSNPVKPLILNLITQAFTTAVFLELESKT